MTRKCMGCGIVLQSENKNELGYVKHEKYEDAMYCEKCFKIKYYGKTYETNAKVNTEIIINDIDLNGDAVVYLVDILNITEDAIKYFKYFSNDFKLILITKFDLLPRGVKEGKIIKYFKENFYIKNEVMCVSAKTKYNIDKFMGIINKNNIKKVYITGLTNAGKSSFINSLLTSSGEVSKIVTSPIPNTTMDYINMKVGDIEIIDTPGFELDCSIYNHIAPEEISNIMPKKELKVKTFQIKNGYSIIIDKILRIDYLGEKQNSLNFYMNNNLEYKKVKSVNSNELKVLPSKTFELKNKKDIVINGLGFVKVNKESKLKIYTLREDLISIRNNMI